MSLHHHCQWRKVIKYIFTLVLYLRRIFRYSYLTSMFQWLYFYFTAFISYTRLVLIHSPVFTRYSVRLSLYKITDSNITQFKCKCTIGHLVTLLLDSVGGLTCLLTSAPAWVSQTTQWGCPPNAAVCVGVWLKRLVTVFTSQPICTRRATHSSCAHGNTESRPIMQPVKTCVGN